MQVFPKGLTVERRGLTVGRRYPPGVGSVLYRVGVGCALDVKRSEREKLDFLLACLFLLLENSCTLL